MENHPVKSDGDITSKPSVLVFKEAIPSHIADIFIQIIIDDLIPKLRTTYPDVTLKAIYSPDHQLVALDFNIILTPNIKRTLLKDLNHYLRFAQQEILRKFQELEQNEGDNGRSKKPMSFTDMLGTYRTTLNHYYLPLLICIGLSVFGAWLYWDFAGLQYQIYNESEGIWGIILNGLIPVILSATFITIIWLIVRKRGLGFFKALMGIFVLFYIWFGFWYYFDILIYIFWDYFTWMSEIGFYIFYYGILFGVLLFLMFIGIKYFKDQLKTWQKNSLILTFGIFLGSILGPMIPTWSLFSLVIFLSIWDLIAVFKGPLGKIANVIMENRQELINKYEHKLDQKLEDEVNSKSKNQFNEEQMNNIQSISNQEEYDVEIEIGSGDLIFYSALVAHTFLYAGNTLISSIIITGLVIIGVLLGAFLTLRQLLKNKRILPALPFSMFLGIGMYGLGILIEWLITTLLI